MKRFKDLSGILKSFDSVTDVRAIHFCNPLESKNEEVKKPNYEITAKLEVESLHKEWDLPDKIINVFSISGKMIFCCQDEKEQYYLKIITDNATPFPRVSFNETCTDLLEWSEKFLVYVSRNHLYLLNYNLGSIIAQIAIPIDGKVLGFLHQPNKEKLLVIKQINSKNKLNLLFYKFDEFHKSFLSSERKPHLSLLKEFKSLPIKETIIDSDGKRLLSLQLNEFVFHALNEKNHLETVSSVQIPTHFQARRINIAIPNGGYINLPHEHDDKSPDIKILDKEFKEIASCKTPIQRINTIHILSDNKTFLVEFQNNNLIGVFKHDKEVQLKMELYELPELLDKLVINHITAQMICFRNDKTKMINDFKPLLNFVEIDLQIQKGAESILPPLRRIVTGYLGAPSVV